MHLYKKIDYGGHLWIEVTQGCNLHCSHCYAASTASGYEKDILLEHEWLHLVEAARPHMDYLTIVGGEPFTVEVTNKILAKAFDLNYLNVAVHSNLYNTKMLDIKTVLRTHTEIVFAFLGHNSAVHDSISGRKGSFDRATNNLRKLIEHKARVRAVFVDHGLKATSYKQTLSFARRLGLPNLGLDAVRRLGRANAEENLDSMLNELCGACAINTLAVSSKAEVYPCALSRFLPIGNIRNTGIKELLQSQELAVARRKIESSGISAKGGCIPTGSGPDPDPPHQGCVPTGAIIAALGPFLRKKLGVIRYVSQFNSRK